MSIYEFKGHFIDMLEVICISIDTRDFADFEKAKNPEFKGNESLNVHILFSGCSKPSLVFKFDSNDFIKKEVDDLLTSYFESREME